MLTHDIELLTEVKLFSRFFACAKMFWMSSIVLNSSVVCAQNTDSDRLVFLIDWSFLSSSVWKMMACYIPIIQAFVRTSLLCLKGRMMLRLSMMIVNW